MSDYAYFLDGLMHVCTPLWPGQPCMLQRQPTQFSTNIAESEFDGGDSADILFRNSIAVLEVTGQITNFFVLTIVRRTLMRSKF